MYAYTVECAAETEATHETGAPVVHGGGRRRKLVAGGPGVAQPPGVGRRGEHRVLAVIVFVGLDIK